MGETWAKIPGDAQPRCPICSEKFTVEEIQNYRDFGVQVGGNLGELPPFCFACSEDGVTDM